MVQRKMRIGFGRVGHLVSLLERKGVAGPAFSSAARDVLVALITAARPPAVLPGSPQELDLRRIEERRQRQIQEELEYRNEVLRHAAQERLETLESEFREAVLRQFPEEPARAMAGGRPLRCRLV